MRYVFDHARDELNIVAIIIVLTDDDKLEEKTSEEASPLILTRQRRIALWRDKDVPQSCTWIYNKYQSEWAAFRSRLERSTKKDGFDLQFILLVGPDCVGSAGITDPRVWNCRDCITSDISRPADFRGDNSMRQISAHTNWKKVEFYRYGIADRIRDRLKGKTEQGKHSSFHPKFNMANSAQKQRRLSPESLRDSMSLGSVTGISSQRA